MRDGRLVGVDLPERGRPGRRRGVARAECGADGARPTRADAEALTFWAGELEAYFRGERTDAGPPTRCRWADLRLRALRAGGVRGAAVRARRARPSATANWPRWPDIPGRRGRSATPWPSNPIPVVVPCHRVIRSDGTLGNYGNDPPGKSGCWCTRAGQAPLGSSAQPSERRELSMADRLAQLHMTVITGMSGAGKSEAVATFEDMGYFCIDNLPPQMLPRVVELFALEGSRVDRVALVFDVRGGHVLRAAGPGARSSAGDGHPVPAAVPGGRRRRARGALPVDQTAAPAVAGQPARGHRAGAASAVAAARAGRRGHRHHRAVARASCAGGWRRRCWPSS